MGVPLYDQLLRRYAPERALARAVARAKLDVVGDMQASLGGGYSTTSGTDPWYRRWGPRPRSANADTMRQLPDQRGQSRDLVRNNAVAASAINTNVARAIGTGLAYSPQPHLQTLGWSPEQGAEWAAEVAAEHSLWADSTECDYYGEQNFYDLQDLVTRSRLESGDCFSVLPDGEITSTMPYRLRVQVLEADRVGNPLGKADTAEFCGGIRRGGDGRVSGIHVYSRHPGSGIIGGSDAWAGDWMEPVGRSGRRRILHHFKRTRPEQARGVPYLAPVMSLFKLAGDYSDAELKAAVVSAFLTLIVTSEAGTGPAPVFGATQEQAAGGELALGPAAVLGLAKGEGAEVVNPMRPNPQFGKFIEAVFDQIGAGTFIGSELLMKKFSTSYTAARAAFLDAWKHLLDVRTRTARDFCQPVTETWMAEAVARGRIRAPGFFSDARLRWAYTRAAWRGDSQGSLNPKDEVAAFRDAVDGMLITQEQAEWELFGTNWNETFGAKVAERRKMADAGVAPVPRAGAGAAPAAAPADPQRQRQEEQAAEQRRAEAAAAREEAAKAQLAADERFAMLAAAISALVAREAPPPHMHFHAAPTTNQAGPTNVYIQEGAVQSTHHVAGPQVQVPVHVAPTVQATVAAPPFVPTREILTRDATGEISEILTVQEPSKLAS